MEHTPPTRAELAVWANEALTELRLLKDLRRTYLKTETLDRPQFALANGFVNLASLATMISITQSNAEKFVALKKRAALSSPT